MATSFYFNDRKITLPGVYSQIKSGIKNTPLALDYGKVLVIDTGTGATFGGGAGIDGTLSNKGDAVYVFDNLSDYQNFLKGGLLWKTAEPLFKPDNKNLGASLIYHVKAASTTPASGVFTATGGGGKGGAFKFKVRDEGIIGNGILTGSNPYYDGGSVGGDLLDGYLTGTESAHLDKGYAWTIETGVYDVAKWIFKIWVGTWKGDYSVDSVSFDEIVKAGAKAKLLVQSPEFDNIQDLIDWSNTDSTFNTYFAPDATSAKAGDGSINIDDVYDVLGYNVCVGGTETYSTTALDMIFETLQEWDGSFILCDKFGKTDYTSNYVSKIQNFIENQSKYGIIMYFGGGKDDTEFNTTDGSTDIAAYFDSEKIVVCHGDVYETSSTFVDGMRRWGTIYTAAKILGRTAGKSPQIPITFKSISVKKLAHNPTSKEKLQALNSGILMLYKDTDFGKFVVLQGVNSLQKNTYFVNPDSTSFSIQLVRIKYQLNKEIMINGKVKFFDNESGTNRNSLSVNYIRDWLISYLDSKVSTDAQDNLLVKGENGEPAFENISVTRQQDAYFVQYNARANSEITKVFFTGFLID